MPICVPGRKLRVYAVISRVRATGPRLLFANVVINVVVDPVGTAGLEPALSCSHDHAVHGARRAAAALHPVNQSERADLNRRSPGPPPTSRVPGRDARLRYVLMSVARAGVEPALPPTTAARRCPRAIGAHVPRSRNRGWHAGFTQWTPTVLESASTAFQAAADQPYVGARFSATDPNEKSPMSL